MANQSHPSSAFREPAGSGGVPSVSGFVVATQDGGILLTPSGTPAGSVVIGGGGLTLTLGDFSGTGAVLSVGGAAVIY